MCGIYAIVVNHLVVYVGKSNDIRKRYKQHWCEIYKPKENKYWLLKSAKDAGFDVKFYLLQTCALGDLFEVEEKWIKLMKPCLNSVHNDKQGMNITPEEFFDKVTAERTSLMIPEGQPLPQLLTSSLLEQQI